MLKIVICDDEEFYLSNIQLKIQSYLQEKNIQDYEIITFGNSEKLIQANAVIQDCQLFFLDINMSGINGIELAEKIRDIHKSAFIVFVTAYIDYAIEGYRVKAIRYIIKDMLDSMLAECMDTIMYELRIKNQKVKYPFIDGTCEIYSHDIAYIESDKHKVIFHMVRNQDNYELYDKLDCIEKGLEQYGFLRIHKSFLVNMVYIEELTRYQVKMKTGEILSIPREKYQYVEEKYYENEGKML